MEGAVRSSLVAGGEDLVAFGVEDGECVGEVGGSVVCDDVEGGDADDFAAFADGVGEGACDGDGDAEAGEAAGAEGEVDVIDMAGLPALGLCEGLDRGHEFGGVTVAFGELLGGEKSGPMGDGDGALAAAGVDGDDARERGRSSGWAHRGPFGEVMG